MQSDDFQKSVDKKNGLGKWFKKSILNRLFRRSFESEEDFHRLIDEGEEEGIIEANNGITELHDLGEKYKVPVSIHLNPTYIAEGCRLTTELIEHGYEPPELSSILEVLKKAREYDMSIYAGLDDEGLAVQGGTFRSTGLDKDKTVKAISAFNKHQDIKKLLDETR